MNDYSKSALEIVQGSNILTEEDFSKIDKLRDELRHTFLHSQVFRTRTEMEVSVLNDVKFPTPDAKYWQSMREQNVHFHELVMLSYKHRKNLVKIKKLERKLAKEEDDLEKEMIQIDIERRKYISINQQRVAKDRIREVHSWHEIKANLIPDMASSLDDVDEHQLISYVNRWIIQAKIMGDTGGPSERHNLFGQLETGIKACIKKGIFNKVLDNLSKQDRIELEDKYL